jgi:hypothetical protein
MPVVLAAPDHSYFTLRFVVGRAATSMDGF